MGRGMLAFKQRPSPRPVHVVRRFPLALLFVLIVPPLLHAGDAKSSYPPSDPTLLLRAAEKAMGGRDALRGIRTISAIATCRGPKGDYETQIQSDTNGNLLFRQVFPDRKPNVAGISNGRGWQQNEAGAFEWIGPAEVFELRNHEFPMMAIQLGTRFQDLRTIGPSSLGGRPTTEVGMTDALGHPASAFFSTDTHFPIELRVTNVREVGPKTIAIRFDAWRAVGRVELVSHVTILFGGETWVFDFNKLEVNTVAPAAFEVPLSLAGPSPK